ncbi:MAG: hypothetical protein KAS15_08275 [Nanoarchaeota archaeon]|nr:hypothetical protein [Nanoarchaeota archaeon]
MDITQDHKSYWEDMFKEGRNWLVDNYYHLTHRISPDYTLDQVLEISEIKPIEKLSFNGIEIDASYDPDQKIYHINKSLRDKNLNEQMAVVIHEMVEAYGISSLIYHGWGFNIIRPEHEYAESVEHSFRQEVKLPECRFKLTEEEFKIANKTNEFFQLYPQWKRYIGNDIYELLIENPDTTINDNFRDTVMGINKTLWN